MRMTNAHSPDHLRFRRVCSLSVAGFAALAIGTASGAAQGVKVGVSEWEGELRGPSGQRAAVELTLTGDRRLTLVANYADGDCLSKMVERSRDGSIVTFTKERFSPNSQCPPMGEYKIDLSTRGSQLFVSVERLNEGGQETWTGRLTASTRSTVRPVIGPAPAQNLPKPRPAAVLPPPGAGFNDLSAWYGTWVAEAYQLASNRSVFTILRIGEKRSSLSFDYACSGRLDPLDSSTGMLKFRFTPEKGRCGGEGEVTFLIQEQRTPDPNRTFAIFNLKSPTLNIGSPLVRITAGRKAGTKYETTSGRQSFLYGDAEPNFEKTDAALQKAGFRCIANQVYNLTSDNPHATAEIGGIAWLGDRMFAISCKGACSRLIMTPRSTSNMYFSYIPETFGAPVFHYPTVLAGKRNDLLSLTLPTDPVLGKPNGNAVVTVSYYSSIVGEKGAGCAAR